MEANNIDIIDSRLFFGWKNFKWLVIELRKLGANEPSYFSQKRINAFIAFYSGQIGMASILIYMMNRPTYLSMGEFLLWAVTEFGIAGYAIKETQKEKREIREHELKMKENEEMVESK